MPIWRANDMARELIAQVIGVRENRSVNGVA
jgi:hypothetical protein